MDEIFHLRKLHSTNNYMLEVIILTIHWQEIILKSVQRKGQKLLSMQGMKKV